jgi:hypothetical protein
MNFRDAFSSMRHSKLGAVFAVAVAMTAASCVCVIQGDKQISCSAVGCSAAKARPGNGLKPYDRTYCQYDVSDCVLTLWVQKDSRDIVVQQDATYDVQHGMKSDGFRYIYGDPVKDFSCVDGDGNVLETEIDRDHGNNLVWFFPVMTHGKKRVIANFTVPGLLKHENGVDSLNVSWAGLWRIPVRHFAIEVVFPKGFVPDVKKVAPGQYEYSMSMRDGQWVLRQEQAPLKVRPFHLEYGSKAKG